MLRWRWALVLASLCLSANIVARLENENSFCFSKLNEKEEVQDWSKEYKIGLAFAADRDFTEAIHSFKRALVLCPNQSLRIQEIEYAILLSYYLDKNYIKVAEFFETHSLLQVDQSFSAFEDLLRILHHTYAFLGQSKKAQILQEQMVRLSEKETLEVLLTAAVFARDYPNIEELSKKLSQSDWAAQLTKNLFKKQKSSTLAKWLNVIVPGMGYFYLGQKKAALCSFFLNSLLIFGSIQLFMSHYYTLGALTAIFEIGWYAGGILGMGPAAHQYNEALFTNYAEKVFFQHHLDPYQKLKYEF